MKKLLKQHFPREKWWNFTLVGVLFFVGFHIGTFYWHGYLVERYDALYSQAVQEGTLVDMPLDFRDARKSAQERNIFTRPDILAREGGILQAGIHSLVRQYQDAIDYFHKDVSDNISTLRTLVQESQEYVFEPRDDIASFADTLESELDSGDYVRVDDLRQLSEVSRNAVQKAQIQFDFVKRKMALQDILALKHEMMFLDSYYRMTSGNALIYDYKVLKKNFAQTFTRDLLHAYDTPQLLSLWGELSHSIEPYRVESKKMRAIAKTKRASLVEKEMKKWTTTTPPEAPLGDTYTLIFVSLKQQMMYVYEDGELILSTPITSGRNNYQTVQGTFHIYTKERNHLMKSPFPDEDYELWVDYWLPFYGAYGIHDACNSTDCWRTIYGTPSYVYNGSHGCVNTPYAAVQFIYGWARLGTTVYIQ